MLDRFNKSLYVFCLYNGQKDCWRDLGLKIYLVY